MPGHGPVVEVRHRQEDHHGDGEDGVEVEGDGLDEQVQAVPVLHVGADRRGPGGHRRDDAHGRRRGVDEVGELRPADPALVGHGPHDGAHGEAVEVVVHEDQHAQGDDGELGSGPGLDVGGGPAPEGGGASGLVHEHHQDAQYHQEDQDAHVVAVGQGPYEPVVKDVGQGAFEVEVGIEKPAHQDAHEQGGVHLLGHEGEAYGDDGGQQRPEGLIEAGGDLPVTLAGGEGHGGGDEQQDQQDG